MVKRTAKTLARTTAIVAKPSPVAVMDNMQPDHRCGHPRRSRPQCRRRQVRAAGGDTAGMVAQAAKIAFDDALAEMQPELPIVTRRGRIEIRKKDPKTGERTGHGRAVDWLCPMGRHQRSHHADPAQVWFLAFIPDTR